MGYGAFLRETSDEKVQRDKSTASGLWGIVARSPGEGDCRSFNPSVSAAMSTCSSIDVDDDDLAELEAEQAALANRLSALQAEQAASDAAAPQANAASALAAENATLRAQLAALESVSAYKSTSRRDGELAKQQAELDKMAAENARLSVALATGVGLSKLTTLGGHPSHAVAASHSRSLALVSRANVQGRPSFKMFHALFHVSCILFGICKYFPNHNWLSRCQLQSRSTSSAGATCSDMKSALKALETKEKGVDICLLMDGSGSMVCSCLCCC